jgi:ribosomal-protein-alanine N-acetyltransferase
LDQTQRLRIEPLAEAHAPAMFTILEDERIYRYIPGGPYPAVEDLAHRYRRLAAGSTDPDERWLNWCLFRREDDTPLGYLQATVSVPGRTAWVAYVLAPTAWGQGYATESLAWLLDFLRHGGQVDRAQARIDSRNAASLAVVERLQFERTSSVEEDGSLDFLYEKPL